MSLERSRKDTKAGAPTLATVEPERAWRRTVLIVEDDPEMWPILRRFSTEADPGVEVDFAQSAPEAEARLASGTRYNVVLTDYCLPRPGGGNAILERAASLQPWARVGMISAKLGFKPKDTPYLAKPFTRQTYRRFLRDLLGWSGPGSATTG
jgi:CheY-like chemotaxis protein